MRTKLTQPFTLTLLVLPLGIAPTAWADPKPLSKEEQAKVDQAIDKGVAFLKRSQTRAGDFLYKAYPKSLLVAQCALPAYALLEAGVPNDDAIGSCFVMNALVRSLFVAIVGSVLAACVIGLRFAYSPADLSAVVHRNEELDQLLSATFRRMNVRRQVVREWMDRRYTLTEALEQFQELDAELPAYIVAVPEVPSGGTNRERRYQLIREEVEAILHDRPEDLAAVLRRLEGDYQRLQTDKPGAIKMDER